MKEVINYQYQVDGEFVAQGEPVAIQANRERVGVALVDQLVKEKCTVFLGVFTEQQWDEPRSLITSRPPDRNYRTTMHVRTMEELLPALVRLSGACTVAAMKAGLHERSKKVKEVALPPWLVPAQIILDQFRPAIRGYLRLIVQQRPLQPEERYLWETMEMDSQEVVKREAGSVNGEEGQGGAA